MYFILGIGMIIVVLIIISLDLFFIPTFILSLISLLGFGGYLYYVNQFEPNTSATLLLVFIASTGLYAWLIVKFKLWKVVSHRTKLSNQDENVEVIDHLIDKEGISISNLHPSGKVEIDGIKYDAMCKTGYTSSNKSIIVIGRSGNQVVVREKTQS